MPVALIGPLGLPELLIILCVLILIFGAKRISGLGRGLGQSIRGFKDEMKDVHDEEEDRRPDERHT
jgi:sec-independent protein translocase protein TatA